MILDRSLEKKLQLTNDEYADLLPYEGMQHFVIVIIYAWFVKKVIEVSNNGELWNTSMVLFKNFNVILSTDSWMTKLIG